MNETAERVAKAIMACQNRDVEALANAALAAIHDPTPEMIMAGAKILGDESGAGRWNALCVWHAMVDEILK